MTPSLPHQGGPPDERDRSAEDPRHKARRRALTLLIIVLLIGVPAGYLVISANQSRNSGKDKEAKYSATGLTAGWPSKVQRRLYQVAVPHPADDIAYYETNNWKTSRLYVQFSTNPAGLDSFLQGMGVRREQLRKDYIAVGERDRKVSGWTFGGPGPWWGLTHEQKNPAPTQDVVVNLSDPERPAVFVVSRTVP
ncbi:sugar kinase [Streptomyces sp. SID486]|uniref:sugar kinase n=1 Tax=unclassified Streptomyces TaxID=2593676 RepID=UPI00136CC8FA|nr:MULTISPECIES: sugar kinase [unclassified Streptomyces]MYW20867.1 sugar kinase [Streptomyces sp. SID2955]MYW49118.1 sugar kinase [Streptomyces sp. SID161]MYX94395.1 sugar kinase [Streptomyces sp. SID486]